MAWRTGFWSILQTSSMSIVSPWGWNRTRMFSLRCLRCAPTGLVHLSQSPGRPAPCWRLPPERWSRSRTCLTPRATPPAQSQGWSCNTHRNPPPANGRTAHGAWQTAVRPTRWGAPVKIHQQPGQRNEHAEVELRHALRKLEMQCDQPHLHKSQYQTRCQGSLGHPIGSTSNQYQRPRGPQRQHGIHKPQQRHSAQWPLLHDAVAQQSAVLPVRYGILEL